MAIAHGVYTRVLLDGGEYSQYLNSSSHSAEGGVEDVTAFGAPNQAKQWARTIQGGKLSVKGYFDPTVLDPNLLALRVAAGTSLVTVGYLGTATGNIVKTLAVLEDKYDIENPVDKVIKFAADFTATGGLTSGVSLTDLTAKVATGNDATVDNGAATTNGGWAQLHVTAASGTTPSAAVVIQHSVDNATWVTLATFAAATAPGAQRVAVPPGTTVDRYLRASWTITGTTPSLTFTASFART